MKRVLAILALLALSGMISACQKKENSQPAAAAKVEQKIIVPEQMKDNELALAFLAGIQNNDKKLMYDVSNLTPELVENSRTILTNSAKYKQTKKERTETEHALRMSGNIDFFLKKLTKILPKTAQLLVIKTAQESKTDKPIKSHLIKIIYSNKNDALVAKNGQKIKEITLSLQQIEHKVNGHTLKEFVFDNKDFEKMSNGEYVVLSHF